MWGAFITTGNIPLMIWMEGQGASFHHLGVSSVWKTASYQEAISYHLEVASYHWEGASYSHHSEGASCHSLVVSSHVSSH